MSAKETAGTKVARTAGGIGAGTVGVWAVGWLPFFEPSLLECGFAGAIAYGAYKVGASGKAKAQAKIGTALAKRKYGR